MHGDIIVWEEEEEYIPAGCDEAPKLGGGRDGVQAWSVFDNLAFSDVECS